jgi:hypothetical protein
MKKHRLIDKFLEELERIPNISVACEKLGISRQSIYRWMSLDDKFKSKVEKAMYMGVDSFCDLAENKLLSNINDGNQRAIEYFLTSNHPRYYRPRKPKVQEADKPTPIISIEHEDFIVPKTIDRAVPSDLDTPPSDQ